MSRLTLISHPNSPFVRKVHAALHALELFDQVDLVPVEIGPVVRNPYVLEHNPIGQIPVLILADGTRLHDSRVILEYLDSLSGSPRLFPQGEQRWPVLVLASLADALLVAAIHILREAGRPETVRWDTWPHVQRGKIESTLDHLEAQAKAGLIGQQIDAGTLGLACAWGFLALREEKLGLQLHRWPALGAWFEAIREQPAISRSEPQQVGNPR